MFSTKACVTCQKNTRFKALVVMAVIFICTMLTGAVNDARRKEIELRIYDDFAGVDMVKDVVTHKGTVEEFLSELQLELGENDRISMTPESAIRDGDSVVIRKGVGFNLVCDGEEHFVSTTRRKIGEAIRDAGFVMGSDDIIHPGFDANAKDGLTVTVTRVAKAVEKETEVIPFTETVVEDASMYNDERVVRVAGVNGEKELSYVVTTHDGEFFSRELSAENVTLSPIEQVIAVGTKPRKLTHKGFTYKKKLTVTATAYDPYPPGGSGLGITANGMKAQYGVVAVDPRVIPLGTKLYIESPDDGASWSYGYCIAADTGGAIKGNKIDLCYNTVSECIQFGRRSANVYILD